MRRKSMQQNGHKMERVAYSVQEIAEAIGAHPQTVRLEIARGNLRATRFARRLLVLKSEFDRYLAARATEEASAR